MTSQDSCGLSATYVQPINPGFELNLTTNYLVARTARGYWYGALRPKFIPVGDNEQCELRPQYEGNLRPSIWGLIYVRTGKVCVTTCRVISEKELCRQ